MPTPLHTELADVNGETRVREHPWLGRTDAEKSGNVLPSNYAFPAEPILFAERYGFVGDGTSLNDTAMQKAIDVCAELGGGVLWLKKGTYLFSSSFEPPESMVIRGAGRLTTTLKANGNFTLVHLSSASSSRNQIRDLTLEGTSKAGTGIQIGDTNHTGQHRFANIRVTGFNVGVRFAAALWTSFMDCLIDYNEIGVDYDAGSGSMYSNDIAFYSTTIQFNDRNGIAASDTPVRCIGLKYIGGSIEQNGSEDPASYPQIVLGAIAHWYFNTYVEYIGGGTKPDGFSLSGASNGEIACCYFLGTATAIKSSAAGSNSIFIHHCDFNSTSTRCIDMSVCPQILALHNEYDLTNNVIDHATSVDITGRVAQSATGSYTGALQGCSTTPTGDVEWTRTGDVITLQVPFLSATSNSTSASITGMPAAIQPSAQRACVAVTTDNGVTSWGRILVETSGTLTLHFQGSATFTASGTKAANACTIMYRM